MLKSYIMPAMPVYFLRLILAIARSYFTTQFNFFFLLSTYLEFNVCTV